MHILKYNAEYGS